MNAFKSYGFVAMLLSLLLFSGCDTAVITNGNILGVQSGQFVYKNGSLVTTYSDQIDKVWQACEQALQELHATNILKERKIASGKLTANIYEDKIIMEVDYVDRDRTTVSVLTGIGGNQLASRLIHEKISKILSSMGTEKSPEFSESSTNDEKE